MNSNEGKQGAAAARMSGVDHDVFRKIYHDIARQPSATTGRVYPSFFHFCPNVSPLSPDHQIVSELHQQHKHEREQLQLILQQQQNFQQQILQHQQNQQHKVPAAIDYPYSRQILQQHITLAPFATADTNSTIVYATHLQQETDARAAKQASMKSSADKIRKAIRKVTVSMMIDDWDGIPRLLKPIPKDALHEWRSEVDGQSLLMHAIMYEAPARVVEVILNASGPEAVMIKGMNGSTPLHRHVFMSSTSGEQEEQQLIRGVLERAEIVRLLVTSNPDAAVVSNGCGRSVLHIVSYFSLKCPIGVMHAILKAKPECARIKYRGAMPHEILWKNGVVERKVNKAVRRVLRLTELWIKLAREREWSENSDEQQRYVAGMSSLRRKIANSFYGQRREDEVRKKKKRRGSEEVMNEDDDDEDEEETEGVLMMMWIRLCFLVQAYYHGCIMDDSSTAEQECDQKYTATSHNLKRIYQTCASSTGMSLYLQQQDNASPNIMPDGKRWRPLHAMAHVGGPPDILRFAVAFAIASSRSVGEGYEDVLHVLSETDEDRGFTSLHHAAVSPYSICQLDDSFIQYPNNIGRDSADSNYDDEEDNDQSSSSDEEGASAVKEANMTLQCHCGWNKREKGCDTVEWTNLTSPVEILLRASPKMALVRDKTHERLPFHYAVECGKEWKSTVWPLIQSSPQSVLTTKDPVSKLYPFMVAAMNQSTSLSIVFELLLQTPHIVQRHI